MRITIPTDEHLCIAPEFALLTALEVDLVLTVEILNLAHTEIRSPGAGSHPLGRDSQIAAALIAQASQLVATIYRYRLSLGLPAEPGRVA